MPRNLSQWRLLGYPAQIFKIGNEGQNQNIVAIYKLLSFLFDSNEVSSTKAFEKISVTGDGSNNLGGLGAEANGGLGAELSTLWRFFQFFSKNKAFLCIFWFKFLENVFLNECKVCC